jgi:hypothetical protein
MRRHFVLATALAAALSTLVVATAAQAEWATIAPPDSGFSAVFPDAPQMKTAKAEGADTRIWLTRTTDLLCLTGATDYAGHIDAERELELDMKNFLTQVKGIALSQKRSLYHKAPDGPLPSLDFTFTTDWGTGEALVVVSGDRAFQIVAIARKGYDGKADIARIVKSFTITVPTHRWQG